MSTTSGLSSTASYSARSAFGASPTASMSGSASRSRRRPERTTAWSSTTRTRIIERSYGGTPRQALRPLCVVLPCVFRVATDHGERVAGDSGDNERDNRGCRHSRRPQPAHACASGRICGAQQPVALARRRTRTRIRDPFVPDGSASVDRDLYYVAYVAGVFGFVGAWLRFAVAAPRDLLTHRWRSGVVVGLGFVAVMAWIVPRRRRPGTQAAWSSRPRSSGRA